MTCSQQARISCTGAPSEGRTASSMRVTMTNKYYPPHLGGIEHHVRDLAEALVRAGDEVRVIVANEARRTVQERMNGVEVVRLARLFAYASTPVAPGFAAALRREARAQVPPDVLHLHFPYPWGESAWLLAHPGLPTVLTYHSDIVRQRRLLALYRPLLERVLDRVDLIIASSPNMVEASPFLAPRANKCRVVPFGIDVDAFALTSEVEEAAAAIRARHVRPIVLFVGRLVYYKGVDVLVRAMADVPADLVIVGTGPLEARLFALADELGVRDRTEIVRSLHFEDLVAYYHAADVLCLPSVERTEAFGLVQIEAQACGTPVVSTRLATGVPFANLDGETGLTVRPGDVDALSAALRTLVTDDALRERLGMQGRARVHAEFTIARMVERTRDVYREALEVH